MIDSDNDELESDSPEDVAGLWKRRILAEVDAHKEFRDLAEKGQEAYDKDCVFNICWPTVQITSASLYSSTPNPEVMRRQRDGDETQKAAAQILERGLDYCLDSHDFDDRMKLGITDMNVAGLGQVRVLYEPEIGTRQNPNTGEEEEYIAAQMIGTEHYSWKDFGWAPCKDWGHCEWIYFVHKQTKKSIQDEYDVEAGEDDTDEDGQTSVKVYEILHKKSKAVIVIADQFDVPLDVRRDKLGIKGFYPCPEPMLTNIVTNKLIPRSDFKYYSTQFRELNTISGRISKLVGATKAIKYYDAFYTEMAKIKTASDGAYIPVNDMIDKLKGAQLENIIANLPSDQNKEIISMLVEDKEYLKSEVFEILGIADIMRGESQQGVGVETQQLKSEFGAVRIRDKQSTVNRFCRDLFRIMGEVMAEHFEPEILTKITGIEATPEVMEILRSDFMRNVSVDIETDSTNAGDKLRNKKEENESLQSLVSGISEILPLVGNGTLPMPVGRELMLLIVRSQTGNTGNLEDIISKMGDENDPQQQVMQLQQQMQQLQQQAQAMQQELEKRNQADTAKNMSTAELNQAKTQEIMQGKIPLTQSEVQLNAIEGQGKKVEQAANILTGAQGREPFIRGVE
jgi:hypothetical protein